jgi:glycosyltransferase A (GT-A) superfamily protein (DUF2064 family)
MLFKTAILLFTQTAKAAAQQKLLGLPMSNKNKEQIFETLLYQTRQAAQATALDVIEINCTEQHGNSFGQRIATATQQVFDSGYEQVIILGTDTPNISSAIISKAAEKTNEHHSVLGHSKDGGAYLIAFHRNNFDLETFAKLQWKSANTATVLMHYFSSETQGVSSLVSLADIDSSSDLLTFITKAKYTKIVALLKQIVAATKAALTITPSDWFIYNCFAIQRLYNRPPPSA